MIDDELKGFFLCSLEIRREILNALPHVPRDCVVLLCRQHLLRNRILSFVSFAIQTPKVQW